MFVKAEDYADLCRWVSVYKFHASQCVVLSNEVTMMHLIEQRVTFGKRNVEGKLRAHLRFFVEANLKLAAKTTPSPCLHIFYTDPFERGDSLVFTTGMVILPSPVFVAYDKTLTFISASEINVNYEHIPAETAITETITKSTDFVLYN